MDWDEKQEKMKVLAEEIGGKFRIEEFADGNRRMIVEVREASRERK
jgi:hypothetical protein